MVSTARNGRRRNRRTVDRRFDRQRGRQRHRRAECSEELGQLQASQISASGVYVVGQDIKSGTWHTPGDGGNNGGMADACYFATLNSTDTTDIADNNNFDGAETVDVSASYAFEIDGPCT